MEDSKNKNYIDNSNQYSDQFFLDNGFHRFERTPFQSGGVIYNFQKRYDDKFGKKYFIDVAKWSWIEFHDPRLSDYTYEFSCQLYKKGSHKAVDITFHCDWLLEEVEEFIEDKFQRGLLDYYERWDEC